MILVDTSVLIDYLKGVENQKTMVFEMVLKQKLKYGISAYTYQEILQGAKDEKEFKKLKDYLSTQIIFFLPENTVTYDKAAHLYFELRRKGITPRSTIDILIILTALENDLTLLHNDKDFDIAAAEISNIKILN